MKPSYQYLATVVSIHDGDTIDVDIDCGFKITFRTPIRFYGINAPELKTPAGKTALAYLETLLSVGDQVLLTTFKDHHEKFGRWLAQVNKGGLDVCQAMVDSGNAVEYLP